MKAIETNKREAITGNYTNSELIRHIENEFPELSGSLLVLLKRFDDQCADDDNPNARNEDEDIVVKCPKCGTQLQIEEE